MSGRSADFVLAQISSIVRAENWLRDEKIEFTAEERIKLNSALQVLNKAQSQRPFIRAMSTLELYENAEKGIELQKQMDAVQKILLETTKQFNTLLDEHAQVKIKLKLYEGQTFLSRLLGLFHA